MQVLFVTSEIHPLVKTGGLADVSGALPVALREMGVDVRILIPGYRDVLAQLHEPYTIADISGFAANHTPARLLASHLPGTDLPLLVLDCPALYDRPGTPYLTPGGQDWPDNVIRFGFFSQVGALLCGRHSPLAWRPQVVHCNDWQSALIPALLHHASPQAPLKSILTVHNLAFQGNFDPDWVTRVGLPMKSFHMHGVEFHGMFSFLKAGINHADTITTVSKTYASEIQTPEFGCGLEGLLEFRRNDLVGIVNGIDDSWNPADDGALVARYDADDLTGKAKVKRDLQNELGLNIANDVPMLGLVGRLTHQKGIDLVMESAVDLLELGVQLAILGSGDAEIETGLQQLSMQHPGRVGVSTGFKEALAHRIIAGSDMFLMPSRYEPCGLAQMYAMVYGSPPIVHRTGGLADTVTDCTASTLNEGTATGFMFERPEAGQFIGAVKRALVCYRDRNVWRALQQNGMQSDFSWHKSAAEYAAIYCTR